MRERSAVPPIRILLVDDYKDWRSNIRLLLQERPEWQVIFEGSDGTEAVQKAGELKPDIILLDIGLPTLNGIEAARQMRIISPNSKIVFLSVENSPDVVHAALSAGGLGYVHKSQAKTDLLPVIEAVLRGIQFVSSELRGFKFTNTIRAKASRRHEALFYPDDAVFLERCTRFIAAALRVGDVAAVVATESYRVSLYHRLKAEGLDIDAAIGQGTYISLDVANTLSTFMVNDMPDWEQFLKVVGGLVSEAPKATKRTNCRVAICGECGPLLCAEGKVDAAIRLEQFLNQLGLIYEFDLLCAYALSSFHGEEDEHVFQRICSEHSAVYSQ
jgi:DNA-binding NarL/FixJ family response regulator